MSSDSEYEDRKPAATAKVDANKPADFKKKKGIMLRIRKLRRGRKKL